MQEKEKGAVGAIIVAAGKGSRMGLGYNKVLADLCGRPVIDWTIRNFVESRLIDVLVLVINPDDEKAIKELCLPYKDEIRFITIYGGQRRQDSVYNGIKILPNNVEIVLIHDGARPFIDKIIIENSIYKAWEYGAVCVGVRARDTIKIVDNTNTVISTPERSSLWHAQTPQAFKKDIILEIYKHASERGLSGTDDASLAEEAGFKVTMIEGSPKNIKLTSKEDLDLGKCYISC